MGDGSYFEPLTVSPSWEGFDLNWWYAAPVSGLGFNDNSVDFAWGPGADVGAPAVITMSPDLGDIAFENRTVTVPPGGESDIGDRFYRTPGTLQVWAEGTVTRDHPLQTESFAMPDPNLFTARALRQALGRRRASRSPAPRARPPIRCSISPRAGARRWPRCGLGRSRDWVFPILNTSQNWFAEMLLKQLGRQFGKAGSWERRARGGAPIPHRFGEGGLDRVLAAGWLGTVQRQPGHAARLHPDAAIHQGASAYATFAAGLPQSGSAGSLRTRFLDTPLARRVRAKTGSIGARQYALGVHRGAEADTLSHFRSRPITTRSDTRTILAAIDSVVVEMAKGR